MSVTSEPLSCCGYSNNARIIRHSVREHPGGDLQSQRCWDDTNVVSARTSGSASPGKTACLIETAGYPATSATLQKCQVLYLGLSRAIASRHPKVVPACDGD